MISFNDECKEQLMSAKKGRKPSAKGPRVVPMEAGDIRFLADRLGSVSSRLSKAAESLEGIEATIRVRFGTADSAVSSLEDWVISSVEPAVNSEAHKAGQAARAKERQSKG